MILIVVAPRIVAAASITNYKKDGRTDEIELSLYLAPGLVNIFLSETNVFVHRHLSNRNL